MTRRQTLAGLVAAVVAAPWFAAQATAQPTGLSREEMWYAPTAADWARPCLITWQRTWEDAVAVSEETGQAILVCVNMDGEIASEHYAGVRYRQPETAALYEPYVTVIASVYRHTPRDHDEAGQRVLCPRFGTVTCGEHIAIEPILYEKFMEGQRIAPRHIMVELDGQETYDVFYAWDTDSVFQAIRDGIANRPFTPEPVIRGDRPILERVASRDSRDRVAVEEAYREGDAALREALLKAAQEHMDAAPVDLLRMAVYGLDVELGQQARQALAKADDAGATELISEVLAAPMDAAEREALIGALERIGASSGKARTLAAVHRGLSTGSGAVNIQDWSAKLGGATYAPADAEQVASTRRERIEQQDQALSSADPKARLELAEAFLARAFDTRFAESEIDVDASQARMLFLDARRCAREALDLGDTGWQAHAVLALAAYYVGESEEAHREAEVAVKALPTGETDWNAMAVLELFAKLRCQAIAAAVREKQDWPGQWLQDVNAACAVLARHPHGTDAQVAWHHDILVWLGARIQAEQVVLDGLERFPFSWDLHERLRRVVLRERGIDALETTYRKLLEDRGPGPQLLWYAGLATRIGAEFHRRRGDDPAAMAAYARAIEAFERAIQAGEEDAGSAEEQIALCLSGQARIALGQDELEECLELLLQSFARHEPSAATLDGLNLSAVDTAKMLLSRLQQAGMAEPAGRLQAALDALDPELLQLPAYEGQGPPPDGGRARRGRGE